MRRNAIIGALLLIAVGIALGTTVFRTDIAQATGLAQSVTVDNADANPVPVTAANPVPVTAANTLPVHEQGTATVHVDNGNLTVSARPAQTPWFHFESFGALGPALRVLFTPPSGSTTLALTSITVDNFQSATAESVRFALDIGHTNCSQVSAFVNTATVPAKDTVHLAFPQPMVFSPGGSNWSLCAQYPPGSALTGPTITGVGFYY
jgi:hypothetical protein